MTHDPGPVVQQPGANLALDIFVLNQHLGALLHEALRGTGVSPALFTVYSQLGQGASSPKALIEVLGIRPATLSGYLTTMEARGDLVRTRVSSDRRGHRLELTEQGRATRDACQARFRTALGAMNTRLGTAAEVTELRLALGRVDSAIRHAHERIAPTG